MTQLESARRGCITPQMDTVAKAEEIPAEDLRRRVAEGRVVIPANHHHGNLDAVGFGAGLLVKVNANIGTSPLYVDLDTERRKLDRALSAGADAVMDLSTGGDLDAIRAGLLAQCPRPFGTVPIYQVCKEAGGRFDMDLKGYLDVITRQARQGVDFITIHAGVTRRALRAVESRLMKSVSRGGALLLAWMAEHGRESFLYEGFGEVIDICREYDVTLSLGDGMRPGCLMDATDEAQLDELRVLGELQQQATEAGVQVMIEGPGHVPLNEVQLNVQLQKKYCHDAPFYVLGPLPTDSAAGYDHIACAIGGALAAYHGVDFLCYVTSKEHIGLPDPEDVFQGTMVTRIAAHIANLARGNPVAWRRDRAMARARREVDWEGMQANALDPETFARLRREECLRKPDLGLAKYCSMCGDFCVFETFNPGGRKP